MSGDIQTFVVNAVASSRASVPSTRFPGRSVRQLGQNLRTFPFMLIVSISFGAIAFIGSGATTKLDMIALGLLLTSTAVLIVTLAVIEPSTIQQMMATGSVRLVQPTTPSPEIWQRERQARETRARPDRVGEEGEGGNSEKLQPVKPWPAPLEKNDAGLPS